MKTKDYSMREMIIDQCLGTGREYTREELQAAVNKALESRGMLPVKSKVTILQDINEMNEKFYRIYDEYGRAKLRRNCSVTSGNRLPITTRVSPSSWVTN